MQVQGGYDVWGQRAVDWAEVQEGFLKPCYEKVLELIAGAPGTRILDVGCGAGGFLKMAADTGAEIAGLDASNGLLDIARKRLPRVDLRLGDLEDLPYPNESFDVVTGFNSFQHGSDFGKGLAEASRVVRQGGKVAMVVWASPQSCDIGLVMADVKSRFSEPHSVADAPNKASDAAGHSGSSQLEALLEMAGDAGLKLGETGEVVCPMTYPDEMTIIRGLMSPAPSVQASQEFGEARVREAILEATAPYRLPDDSFYLKNKFRYLVTTR